MLSERVEGSLLLLDRVCGCPAQQKDLALRAAEGVPRLLAALVARDDNPKKPPAVMNNPALSVQVHCRYKLDDYHRAPRRFKSPTAAFSTFSITMIATHSLLRFR
jgi:hypothetical protein